MPLTPIQQWFFQPNPVDPHHYNQAVLLEAREPLDAERLSRAVDALLLHHDALRLQFEELEGRWRQEGAAPDARSPFSRVDLSGVASEARSGEMERFDVTAPLAGLLAGHRQEASV